MSFKFRRQRKIIKSLLFWCRTNFSHYLSTSYKLPHQIHFSLFRLCGNILLPLGCLNDQTGEKIISFWGMDCLKQWSQVVSQFSELLCLDVPGTATEQVRTCGFRRNLSSFDKAPMIRDSVLLNSFESFLVTLPSISSETWEMYSWVSSGSSVFCALLFLAPSGVSLETADNFPLFLNVSMLLREISISGEDWIWVLFITSRISSCCEGNVSVKTRCKQFNIQYNFWGRHFI